MPRQRRSIMQKGRSAPRRGVLLPPAAKVPKNAVQTCGLKIPCASSPATYLDRISYANAVPCKFPLNVVSSLLLFPLPLLLRNAGLHNFTSQRENIYKNSGQRPPPTFAASRQRRDLIIATHRRVFPKREGRGPPSLVVSRRGDF